MSKIDLQNELTERLREKRTYMKKVEEVDTEIIGIRLKLDRISEKERYVEQQHRDAQHGLNFDD